MKKKLMLLAGFALASSLFAQTDSETAGAAAGENDPVRLPAAEVSADKETTEHITQEQMNERGDSDLWEAMRWVPGVVQSNGSQRNESAFTLRGFDASAVPVYVDGVPWIDPSRGQVDYARFLSGDLESIDIAKGYSSVLLGPNNMGGAVIMRMAKPKKAFEANLKTSWDFDGGGYAGNLQTASVGSKQDLFYAKATFQYRGVDHYRLPSTFVPSFDTDGGKLPGAGGNPQMSGNRLWSDSSDIKVSAVFGVTPMAPLDVWLTYVFSDAKKGFSPPAVNGVTNAGVANPVGYQVWEWPYITRHTVTLNGEWKQDAFNAKAMIYFDKFDNRLDIYGNGDTGWKNYIAGTPSSGHSDYDDYTLGANLEGGYAINTWNKIKAGFQFRQTSHKVVDDGKETSKLLENIWSIDAEYSVNPFKAFTAVAGLGLDAFTPQDYWKDGNGYSTVGVFNPAYFDNKSDSQFLPTFQLGLFYDLTESHELHLTYARKNRFPTPFERYSSRFGTTVPNPNLGPEYADHFEFGYKGYFLEKISITSALYLSNVTNKIATTQVPDPDGSTTPKSKSENLDKAFIYGFEFGTEVYLNQFFSVGGSLGVNKYNITESKAGLKYLGYSPELTANGYLVIKPFENFNLKPVSNIKLIPRFEYVGSRYISSSATKPAILESYTLVHLKAAADITDNVSFSFAINNLFDELYEIRQYFPQAGLSVNLTLEGRY